MMTSAICASSRPDIQELRSEELDAVSGASPILIGIIFAELFALGFVGGMIVHKVMYPEIQFPD